MQCNIDARGQAVRMKLGIIGVTIGLIIALIWWLDIINLPYLEFVSLAALIGGGFTIFEAKTAWCVIRAMGFKTRI
ncbi:MAG: hypothetical protein QGI21_00200 [Candidatus Poseidoniaceae archaeon]|nr:hypothetical protein [Candidatus Poseidoniaceae archaeon]